MAATGAIVDNVRATDRRRLTARFVFCVFNSSVSRKTELGPSIQLAGGVCATCGKLLQQAFLNLRGKDSDFADRHASTA